MLPEKRLELVHFQLTRNCNLRCWFCGQWGRKGFFSDASGSDMTLEDWKKAADSLIRHRLSTGDSPSVILWGGEPLTSPYFREISDYLKQNEFELGIVTNGLLIDKFADTLKNNFKKIYVSIDGPREIHDSIRGRGVFDKVCSNVELVSGGNAEIILMSVLSPALLEVLPEFPDSVARLKPSQLLLQEMIHMSAEEVKSYSDWLRSCFNREASEIYSWQTDMPEDFEQCKKAALSELAKKSFPFEVKHMPHGAEAANSYCLSPYRHLHIAWNGNVMYCTDYYDFCAGNVKQADITEIFNNDLSEKYRQETFKGNCISCNHCSWKNNTQFRL